MKKIITTASLTLVVSLVAGSAMAGAMLKISTGTEDGGYDGTICQDAITPPLAKKKVSTQCVPSLGSIENMKRTNSGETDAGITQVDQLYAAWEKGEPWADNLNPAGRAFTTESMLCFSAGQAVTGMKQMSEPRLDGKKWKIVTPAVDSGSYGSLEYFVKHIPGYTDNVEIAPVTGEWDINSAISRLNTRNPRKQAHAVCFVGLPDPSSDNIKAVANNDKIDWITMDDNRALQLVIGEDPVYAGITDAPVEGGLMSILTGKPKKTVPALQIPVTYVYNDNISKEALAALAETIDQNEQFLQNGGGIMGYMTKKLAQAKQGSMNIATKAAARVGM